MTTQKEIDKQAAKIMLEVIKSTNNEHVNTGFKAAGGIKNVSDARDYVNLASNILGEHWVKTKHFRFGSNSLLANLLSTLNYIDEENNSSPRY